MRRIGGHINCNDADNQIEWFAISTIIKAYIYFNKDTLVNNYDKAISYFVTWRKIIGKLHTKTEDILWKEFLDRMEKF